MTATVDRAQIRKKVFWRASGDQYLATVIHTPAAGKIRDVGVIICPPLGHEHVNTFRSFRVLADQTAAAGFATLRFEYRGTGNSSGPSRFDDQVDAWVEDINCQINGLKTEYGVDEVCLIGFWISTLLARAAIGGQKQVSLISWAPCKSAKSYTRELNALSRISDYAQASSDAIECGGFTYSNSMLDDLQNLEQRIEKCPAPKHQFDTAVNSQSLEEFQTMMLEPHLSDIPAVTIRTATEWLSDTFPRELIEMSTTRTEVAELAELTQSDDTEAFSETLVWDADHSLAGVLCRANSTSGVNQLVLIPNAGSVHSMGPNRVYAELARGLASQGIASFRFDLPNLGESVLGFVEHENEPYLEEAPKAILSTIEYARSEWHFESFALAGLCSGSYNIFMTALSIDARLIDRLVLINPLTFYWEVGMPFRLGSGQGASYESKYYKNAALSQSSWLKFFKGQANYGTIARVAIRGVMSVMKSGLLRLSDQLRITGPSKLGRELSAISSNSIMMNFVFSSRDPGLELLRTEARFVERQLRLSGKLDIDTVDDADHTFSQSRHRQELISTVGRLFL